MPLFLIRVNDRLIPGRDCDLVWLSLFTTWDHSAGGHAEVSGKPRGQPRGHCSMVSPEGTKSRTGARVWERRGPP